MPAEAYAKTVRFADKAGKVPSTNFGHLEPWVNDAGELKHWPVANTTTTKTGLTAGSEALSRCPGFLIQETTS
jgi:hypothetical protein